MVGYVLRPSPDKGYFGLRLFSQAARWWLGSLPRWRAQALAGVAGGQMMATPSLWFRLCLSAILTLLWVGRRMRLECVLW
jgi:hypothetical protein